MKNVFYYNALSGKSSLKFSRRLLDLMVKEDISGRPLILLCIGTDRSTGDSLGPLIGYKLQNSRIQNLSIYGTLQSPVHAVNLCSILDEIYAEYENPFIIAVDASLGASSHVGYVTLSNMPLRPGLGVKKSLPEVGDICITGIVNLSGVMDGVLLQSTRLSTVMELADFITSGILLAFYSYSSSSITCISR
jgi:putative sporulation protein YyaC